MVSAGRTARLGWWDVPRRSIDTAIWDDARFCELGASAQLLFFRLVTGGDTSAAGTSRAPLRRLAADCGGLAHEAAAEALGELVGAGLVRRYGDAGEWLWLPAWVRHQVSGPGFIRAVRRAARECPEALRRAIDRALEDQIGPDRADRARTTPRRTRDKKGADKQGEVGSDGGSLGGSDGARDQGSIRGEVQDQDQDPGPTGLRVRQGQARGNGPGPARADPAGPPALSVVGGEGLGKWGDVRSAREALDALRGGGRPGGAGTVSADIGEAEARLCDRCGWELEADGSCASCDGEAG